MIADIMNVEKTKITAASKPPGTPTIEQADASMEELKSINKGLIAVNLELKAKVEETVKINDDLQNLISSSDIATIFVDRDGSRFYCSDTVYPLVDGGLQGYAKIARDLTEKRIEDYEAQSTLARAKASNILKDEFIAVMSHELRHPLNLIQLNMDLLSRTPAVVASPNAIKAIDSVRRSVRNQSQIIADLLDLSRVQTGKLKLDLMPMNLGPSVVAILQAVKAEAKEAQVALKSNGLDGGGAEALVLNADVTRIEQIVWNLLNNAIKFTPPGGTVTVTLTRENGNARLDVIDTGIGIAAESIGKVFTMFGQVDRHKGHSNRQGLGIGLALVARLIKAHGGHISVVSGGDGHGSTFTLKLPLAEGHTHVAETTPRTKAGGMLNGIRLLLVDDSPEILDMLGSLCELEGAQVTTALNGTLALEHLADNDFDIMISDIGMPIMDGYELLGRLRKSSRNTAIPAVALSGYGYSAKARAAGFTDHLCKPVPMTELLNKLHALTNGVDSVSAGSAS